MKPKTLQQGAEAVIVLSEGRGGRGVATGRQKFVIKNRIKKSYRLPELDEKIRKQRTKAEAKMIERASKFVFAPRIIKVDEKNKKIFMEYIRGKKLSEHLDKFPLAKQKQICKLIGQSIAKLHDNNIIHGDLTTSNLILVKKLPAHSRSQIDKKTNNKKLKANGFGSSLTPFGQGGQGMAVGLSNPRAKSECVYFIDFGLSFISNKIEDKAVDLHLLKQALEAKHFKNWETLFKEVIKGHRRVGGRVNAKKVLERLKAVERRGRYKGHQ